MAQSEMNTPNLPQPGAVLFAKDLPRVARFYEGVVGLVVVATESDHIVLERPHFQLVLHGIPQKIAASISITSPPQLREAVPVKLVFPVASLAAARAMAPALGGGLSPTSKEWEARGFRACDGYDPEGNVVQFREAVA
ncbi:MAG: VOC family protein [Pseudomonadota bacterium]